MFSTIVALVRIPDPGIVARLGAAADGALRAGSPGHLSEMCRLKSPSPACRRLVLGLVAALGLRCAAVLFWCYVALQLFSLSIVIVLIVW